MWKNPGVEGTDARSMTVPDNTSTPYGVPATAPGVIGEPGTERRLTLPPCQQDARHEGIVFPCCRLKGLDSEAAGESGTTAEAAGHPPATASLV